MGRPRGLVDMMLFGRCQSIMLACTFGFGIAVLFMAVGSQSNMETVASNLVLQQASSVGLGKTPTRTVQSQTCEERVVWLVIGLEPGKRTPWARPNDILYGALPPQTCSGCPSVAKIEKETTGEAKDYKKASSGWWCAQRTFLDILKKMHAEHPNACWYMLADVDTIAFPQNLDVMLDRFDKDVLSPGEDLYMGHGAYTSFVRFIMSGGGVLLRGPTVQRLVKTGTLDFCIQKVYKGSWCFHHLDWLVAECLREIGVYPRGHDGFQQMLNVCPECCTFPRITCHPVPLEKQPNVLARHASGNKDVLTDTWATPCRYSDYYWESYWRSNCTTRASSMI